MVIKEFFKKIILAIKNFFKKIGEKIRHGAPKKDVENEIQQAPNELTTEELEERDEQLNTIVADETNLNDTIEDVEKEEQTIPEVPDMEEVKKENAAPNIGAQTRVTAKPATTTKTIKEKPCDVCDCERNETTYSAPCAVGDMVYRVVKQTDDNGNVSWKVSKGKVIAIEIDAEQVVWLKVNFGVGVNTLNLPATEFDFNTQEVGARVFALQK